MDEGIKVINEFSKKLPGQSGIYKMLAFNNEVLYIGKAKNLYKRVKSYSNPMKLNYRLQKMIFYLLPVKVMKLFKQSAWRHFLLMTTQ